MITINNLLTIWLIISHAPSFFFDDLLDHIKRVVLFVIILDLQPTADGVQRIEDEHGRARRITAGDRLDERFVRVKVLPGAHLQTRVLDF